MQPNRPFFLGDRRRLVNLSNRPLFQLKLPLGLLLISAFFGVVFAAHTHAAYGRLISAGFEDAFLHELAAEIRFDYFVVSGALVLAWCLTILGVCLAVTHHFLGPIVALKRRIAQIKAGRYEQRSQIREGHPLRAVSDELDALARLLSGEDLTLLEEDAQQPLKIVPPLASADGGAEILETELVSEASDSFVADVAGVAGAAEVADAQAATPWVGWYARIAN